MGFDFTLLAYLVTNKIAVVVIISQTTIRYSIPENKGTSAIPCAIPIVKGFKNAPAKPAPAPIKGIATPVIVS